MVNKYVYNNNKICKTKNNVFVELLTKTKTEMNNFRNEN